MAVVHQDDLVLDNWANLSFKRVMGSRRTPGFSWLAPSWVGDHDRRLMAYKVLQAYVDNSARWFLQTTNQDDVDNHREYGDAELVRNTILAALVGEDQQIHVDGADDFDPNATDNTAEATQANDLQEWLREWAWTDERMGLKIIETERNAVGLGDGVYVLGWDPVKRRTRLRVFDPGFYFPVLSDQNEDEFPRRLHIAWELPPENGNSTTRVRRITWEMGELATARTYPWRDGATKDVCLMTDGIWTIDNEKGGVDDLAEGNGEFSTFLGADGTTQEFRRIDIGLDFIPVVHIPNTVSILNHYGRSSLAIILQVLDDLSATDTDLQASSGTTGKPPIAIGGAAVVSSPTYRPGELWAVGDGTATMIDTSKALDALLKYAEHLLKRLSVNARVPESVLGRVDISGQLAGITLSLSFGPLESMVREMRLVRDEKYPLLLKFAQRIARAGGVEDVPDVEIPARVEFGRFLPSDQSAAADMVTKLLTTTPPAISLETAVLILTNAGFPIDDANEEVLRITSRDFKGADLLASATGDDTAVRDYLQLQGPPPAPLSPAPPVGPVQPPPGAVVPEANPPVPAA